MGRYIGLGLALPSGPQSGPFWPFLALFEGPEVNLEGPELNLEGPEENLEGRGKNFEGRP